ncbi:hypothetical protein V8V91_13105 [Algoriphagus halophilus]|uniref:hypothetical protein n=1 Tax=Algoriphagus halophilus TaxID=226505 RepID=UPI00358FC797
MKKSIIFTLAGLSMVLGSFAVVQPVKAQSEPLCRWSEQVQFCLASAPDGYCAYGGPDCSTTYPVVE